MDKLDYLPIRFHFDRAFFSSDGQLKYVGGSSKMSYIEMDKLSLPEIIGHLTDHVVASYAMRLHWLCPGSSCLTA
ncbi:hypothetical protein BAE44_0016968 [Dichanthelium oligosanthes]|uniref:Uncharacterized protein n=1 Tax=Dichanthelium oligosanthes TaxID=888268 RepID=A0A1E5VA34_9POAL|nr:hypothetical protein BAE44_0016968 [Dichanthelium oligosanthes]